MPVGISSGIVTVRSDETKAREMIPGAGIARGYVSDHGGGDSRGSGRGGLSTGT